MQESISTKSSHAYDSLYHIASPTAADADMPPTYSLNADLSVPEAAILQLETDGVVCLRNVLDIDTIETLREEADIAVANRPPTDWQADSRRLRKNRNHPLRHRPLG